MRDEFGRITTKLGLGGRVFFLIQAVAVVTSRRSSFALVQASKRAFFLLQAVTTVARRSCFSLAPAATAVATVASRSCCSLLQAVTAVVSGTSILFQVRLGEFGTAGRFVLLSEILVSMSNNAVTI